MTSDSAEDQARHEDFSRQPMVSPGPSLAQILKGQARRPSGDYRARPKDPGDEVHALEAKGLPLTERGGKDPGLCLL